MMGFLWPVALWGLASLPLFVAVYLWLLHRSRRAAVRFPQVDTLVLAMATGHRFRRHILALLFLAALVAAIGGLARPVMRLPAPANLAGVMLAIDVSGSMLSTDVTPTRLEAAKAAAKAFVTGLPGDMRAGLVTFAGDAVLHVPPVTDHQRVAQVIDAIGVRHRTAIGDGLVEAVAALPGRVRPLPDGSLPSPSQGSRPPGVVVLLSDGGNNSGVDPLQAADIARREVVTVYTIGIGRRPGEPASGWVIGGPVDEETLQAIARHTGGEYYHPSSAGEMRAIYGKLARRVGWEIQPVEVTAALAALGAGALMAALVVSLRRPPLP
ncbi:MAG TPA: VWA domain-containing protein [bacterium]|nr:VWA domain-containing protein [bacterium]